MKQVLRRNFILLLAAVLVCCAACGCSVFRVTVTFCADDGAAAESITVSRGEEITLPIPERSGEYVFEGWYYDEAYRKPVGAKVRPVVNLTLHARWVREGAEWTFAPDAEGTGWRVCAYAGTDTYVRIPSEHEGRPVTTIGSNFLGKRAPYVHGIDIPSSVTTVDDYAFCDTEYLEELVIPATVTSLGDSILELKKSAVILRKYVYIEGDPDVTAQTFRDPSGSFGYASIVARPETEAARCAQLCGSKNDGVTDAVGILDVPKGKVKQYGVHGTDGAVHALVYDTLPVRSAVNASQVLHNLRFGYASEVAVGSVAEQVLSEARTTLYGIINDEMTQTQRIHAIYDWVTARCTYDDGILDADTAETWLHASFGLEGVFLNGLAVCDGYAKAVELLCRMEGIDCVRVIGCTDPTDALNTGHAWNVVRADGESYLLDATFGDVEDDYFYFDNPFGAAEITDHSMMLTEIDDVHVADPPFEAYAATGSPDDFWRSVTGDGFDALIDSVTEARAFAAAYADRIAAGGVVQCKLSERMNLFERDRAVTALKLGLNAAVYEDVTDVLTFAPRSWSSAEILFAA